MGLIAQIQSDIQSIRTNTNDFAVSITLTATDSPATSVTTAATVRKHHTQMNELGIPARNKGNTIQASCTVSTLALDELNYPYRNNGDRVTFKNHKVSFSDIAGNWNYKVEEWYPNEMLGEIVLILGLFDG